MTAFQPLRIAVGVLIVAAIASGCGSSSDALDTAASTSAAPPGTTTMTTAEPLTSEQSDTSAAVSRVVNCEGQPTSAVSSVVVDAGVADAETAVAEFRSAANPDWLRRTDWHELSLLAVEEQSPSSRSYIYGTTDGATKLVLEVGIFEGQWFVGGHSACEPSTSSP